MEVTTEELAARLGDERLLVLDVRSPEEFRGEAGAACDPRQGHIPGAVNLDVTELLELSPEGVRARLGDAAEVVAYCHSGSRSRIAVELLRRAGYDARNYAGSWHEWSRAVPGD